VTIVAYDAIPGARQFELLNRAIEAAHLQVQIAAEYPLASAAQAQQRVEAGHILGKVVLRVH
jgi:NADPH:quinone reductase-like Zn-dependent oxidoreductase